MVKLTRLMIQTLRTAQRRTRLVTWRRTGSRRLQETPGDHDMLEDDLGRIRWQWADKL